MTYFYLMLAGYVVFLFLGIFGVVPYLKVKGIIGKHAKIWLHDAIIFAIIWPISLLIILIMVLWKYGIGRIMNYSLIVPARQLFAAVEQFFLKREQRLKEEKEKVAQLKVEESQSDYRRVKYQLK